MGTGNPTNMTKYKWGLNIQRDTIASHLGHFDQLSFFSTVENESIGRVKYEMLEKMIDPCAPATGLPQPNANKAKGNAGSGNAFGFSGR